MKKIFTLLFFALVGLNNINAATFSSIASGNFEISTTWTVTSGTDTDGIPDSNDDVTINTGHTVTLGVQNNNLKTLVIANGATLDANNKILNFFGDITVNGSINGAFFYFRNYAPAILTCASTFTNAGVWHIYSNLTVAAGTTVDHTGSISLFNSASLTNNGSVYLRNQTTVLSTSGSTSWTNNSNSLLHVSYPLTTSTSFNFTTPSNTLVCAGTCTAVPVNTYYDLELSFSGMKTALGNITVLNDLTMTGNAISNTFNLNNFNLNIAGDWFNNSNITVQNQGTITFDGVNQTINRTTSAENFKNLIISSTGTLSLNQHINVTQSLTVSSGSSLDVSSSNYSVTLTNASLVNNGAINARQGMFLFTGSSAQTISGSTNTQFYNLRLNNAAGLTISSPQSLTNILTPTFGTFKSNGNFTLISDGTSTGIIGTVGPGGAISGSMTIQKHISSRAANYHDLSSPVSNTTIMDWDDDLYMSGIGPDDGITGPAGVDGNSGSDSTVYYWNEPTGSYRAVTGSTTALVVGRGYEIFIADDLTSWAARTIDTKGTPNYGTKTLNLSYTAGTYAGLNLVGNPYAASVNYSACPKTNVSSNIYILDDSGNYTAFSSNTAVIPPLQGFWVEATGSGATLTFTETCKSTSTATNFYRTKPNYGIKLVFSSQMLPFYNENTVNFETNTTLDYDMNMDALYLKSPNKNAPAMYMLTNTDAKLITNTIDTKEEEVSIPLAFYCPKAGVYQISPSISNLQDYSYAWIENLKTKKKYDLNSTISFEGDDNQTNTDFALRLSKKSANSSLDQAMFDNDLVIFSTENVVNIKAISSTHNNSTISIYDITGKLLVQETNVIIETTNPNKIDISNLSNGVYIVTIESASGSVKTQKIIK